MQFGKANRVASQGGQPNVRPLVKGRLAHTDAECQYIFLILETTLNKTTTYLIAALFAVSTGSAFAAKHMASEKDDKKPTAAECKKDPKMKGCDDMKDTKKK